MFVAGIGDTGAKQRRVLIDRLDDGTEHHQEHHVAVRRIPRIQEIDAVVGSHAPVVVLARAVDTREGFLMQQTHEVMSQGDFLQGIHRQLVVVGRHVDGREDRGQFVLRRRHLVVLRLGGDSELPQFVVDLVHEAGHAFVQGAEVVVLQFLASRRLGTKQRPAGQDQVEAFLVERAIDQKILLLGPHRRHDATAGDVAQRPQDADRLLVQGIHGPQERCFLIQRLACIRAKGTGDAQRDVLAILLDKHGGGTIPSGIASGFEGGAQAARGERGRIGLALDQFLAAELHDREAVGCRRDERIVFLGGQSGHRLKPVAKVGRSLGDGPVLHRVGNHVGGHRIQRLLSLQGSLERFEDVLGQTLAHGCLVKHIAAKGPRHIISHRKTPHSPSGWFNQLNNRYCRPRLAVRPSF